MREGHSTVPEDPTVADQRRNAGRQEIVVIDDDPDIRTTIAVVLEREGYSVTTFDDGQSALDAATERPTLILLDYMMPRLNAAEFLHARDSHRTFSDVPVVIISAYPELAETVVAETVGVLHKPIDLDILVECVHYHCARTASQC
jgi:DNA-binding response OmpR family regulator